MRNRTNVGLLAITVLSFLLVSGLIAPVAEAQTKTVNVWMHSGKPMERAAMNEIINRFNANHDDIKAVINYITEVSYEEKVKTAAVSGNLPDVLDVDGPYVADWAWRDIMMPIGEYVPEETRDDFLDSIIDQGTWNGDLYALGQFESGMGLYYRKSILEEAGVTPPKKLENAWSWSEFMDACEKVMETGEVDTAVDLKWEYKGEWKTYGFSPLVWSNGGKLIGPDGLEAEGYLNDPKTVEALEAIQELVDMGYADPAGPPQQFMNEQAAMVIVGHWMYAPYKEKFGDDIGLTYYPGMEENVTGSGSYTWGVSEQTDNPEAAAEVLKWIVKPESILIMTKGEDMDGQKIADGNSAPPARESVYEHFPEYTEYPLQVFTTQLEEGVAQARPTTPVYGTLTNEFRKAINNIVQGADVQEELDDAAEEVDDILEERDYFGLK